MPRRGHSSGNFAISHLVCAQVRCLSSSTDATVERGSWESPRIFGEIQRLGGISDDEMAKVFNLGIGMIVAVPGAVAQRAIEVLAAVGQKASVVGEIVEGSGLVHLR